MSANKELRKLTELSNRLAALMDKPKSKDLGWLTELAIVLGELGVYSSGARAL